MIRREETCDSCGKTVHTDRNAYWVGEDETSECEANDRGHTVDGRIDA